MPKITSYRKKDGSGITSYRKKDGGPKCYFKYVKFYESPETIMQFDSVRQWLQKNCKKHIQADPPTAKGLAALVNQLVQFQEEAFGRNVSKPQLTKLPMKCFLDFRPSGALCHILAAAYKFKCEQGWLGFNFQSHGSKCPHMDRNVEMFMTIEKTLVQNKCLTLPHIFIMPEVEKQLVPKLKDIIKRHQGTITENPDDASHLVHPLLPATDSPEDWVRVVFRREKSVKLHWWFYPDSYDTWVPGAEINHEPESPESVEEPFEVNARWLLDLDEFNEWMNVDDYEVEMDALGRRPSPRGKYTIEELLAGVDADKKDKKSIKKGKSSTSPISDKRKRKVNTRTPSVLTKTKSLRGDFESDDLIIDMEEPSPEPNVQEVHIPKNKFNDSCLEENLNQDPCKVENTLLDDMLSNALIDKTSIASPDTTVLDLKEESVCSDDISNENFEEVKKGIKRFVQDFTPLSPLLPSPVKYSSETMNNDNTMDKNENVEESNHSQSVEYETNVSELVSSTEYPEKRNIFSHQTSEGVEPIEESSENRNSSSIQITPESHISGLLSRNLHLIGSIDDSFKKVYERDGVTILTSTEYPETRNLFSNQTSEGPHVVESSETPESIIPPNLHYVSSSYSDEGGFKIAYRGDGVCSYRFNPDTKLSKVTVTPKKKKD